MTPAPNITIPPEVVEAAAIILAEGRLPEYSWMDLDNDMRGMYREDALAALRAGIAAWPGAEIEHDKWKEPCTIHLPLPQEASDDV